MITIRYYSAGPYVRMRVTGHASKWICGAVTMLTQACGGWSWDKKAFHRLGRSDVQMPRGESGRFVRWILETLAAEKPKEVRIAKGAPRDRRATK